MKRYWVIGRKRFPWVLLGAFLYLAVIVLGLWNMAATLAAGASDRQLPIYSVDRREPVVSLTFNCAWDENNIPEILALLKQEKITATFFLVGQWMEKYPESVRQIAAAGHEIGNHSYSHVDFVGASEEELRRQLDKTDQLIDQLTGQKPKLVRVPSGSYDNRVIRLLREWGYEVIQWDLDSRDWKGVAADEMTRKMVENVQNGSILLFHSGAANSYEALPGIITKLREKGYGFVPVSQLILNGETAIDHTGRQKPAE